MTDARRLDVRLRPATPADAGGLAPVIHGAFKEIAERHGFSPAFPSIDVAAHVATLFIDLPAFYNLVAEVDAGATPDGAPVVGGLFLDEGDPVRGVALVAVDPAVQGQGVGRRLLTAALARAAGARSVRLVQEAFNVHALALYASLGFDVVEPLVRVIGRPRNGPPRGADVRPLTLADMDACAELCRRVHGVERSVDLLDGVRLFSPFALVRGGRITAYTYVVFDGHLAWGIGETEDELAALLTGVAGLVQGPLHFNVPTRRARFLRWCLAEGFRLDKPLTLMATGEYQEPRGAFFPSGIY